MNFLQIHYTTAENPSLYFSRNLLMVCETAVDQDHFGYKNHIAVEVKHKFIRAWQVTAANVHDSQVFLEPGQTRFEKIQ